MELRFGLTNIVIISSAHNPSIISPQWLKDNSLIIEEPKNFVNTPDVSLFESDSFSLIIDNRRLQISAKKNDNNSLKSLVNIANAYLKLLPPHILFRALGFNFIWHIEINNREKLPKIRFNINKSDLESIFNGYKIDYGGIIYARKKPYILKLVIEPTGKNTIVNNFNYHYGLKNKSGKNLAKLIDNFYTFYKDSLRIVKSLSFGEEE